MEKLIRWFENIGTRYVNNILSIVDLERMKQDNEYGLKIFLYYWAFERQNAPGGYKIAAIKSISSRKEFIQFYKGKPNEKNNPAMDNKLKSLNLNKIINYVVKKDLKSAFDALKFNGIGHKIRSFFLRDIFYLSKISEEELSVEDFLYLSPIDVWIRITINNLDINDQITEKIHRNDFSFLNTNDLNTALRLIKVCKKSQASPLLTNMGIWFFCSRCVGDEGRLIDLLKSRPVIQALENELNLMDNFENLKISFNNDNR